MKLTVQFGERTIGDDEPVLVVAEIGVNTNGERELGLRQLRAAAGSGADAAKLQTFRADELASSGAPTAGYQRSATGEPTQREMLERLELSEDDLSYLLTEGRTLGITTFSTPFDPESARTLARLGVAWMKVPSGEITNDRLIAAIAATGLPTMMSTGASDLEEVRTAVELFRSHHGGPLVLLHCVSSYPAPLEQMNLRAMTTLRRTFGVPVGLSDHTVGRDAAVAAVALGASVIEKHFTVDRSLPGPDHAMSMEPAEFADMVATLRRVQAGLGTGEKRPVPAEAEVRTVARRSVVARTDLPAGTILTDASLAVRRPGTGLPPSRLPEIIGRSARRPLRAGEIIRLEDLEPA